MKHKYERTEKPYEFNIEGSVREYRCANRYYRGREA